ncbi:MAG: glycosyltransferase family 2 protein [bacterium]
MSRNKRPEKPFITVVVPIRNEEKHIDQCLESIAQQDYGLENFEVLVVDGLSDDGTRAIVEKYVQAYPNFFLVDNRERYVPFAMNLAIRRAKGEIIARMDGHAAMEPDYLTQTVRALRQTGAECVGGQIASINQTRVGQAIALAMSSTFGVGNSRFRTAGADGYVDSLAFGVYHRDIFSQIGLFDEFMIRCQDDEFNFRLRDFGGKVYLTSKMRCKYYPRSSIKKLWKQYFGYGFFKVRLLQKYPRLMQLRQFVPFLFVSGFLGSLILLAGFGLLWPFLLLTMTYLSGCALFTFKLCSKNGFQFALLLPVIFATLHFSYGTGFFWGLIKFSLVKPGAETIPQFSGVATEPINV